MTIAERRFLNLLAQPEEKSGFNGVLAAAHYYLYAGESDRSELRSLMHEIALHASPVNADLMLYVMLAAKDRRFEPTLRVIADRGTPLADVANQVLESDIGSWSESPPHREWMGAPLSTYEGSPDPKLLEGLQSRARP